MSCAVSGCSRPQSRSCTYSLVTNTKAAPRCCGPVPTIVTGNAKQIAYVLVAGRIGVISAYGAVVIARGYHCCTDGSGTNAHTHAAAHVGSAISAAPLTAADMNAARADSAAIRQGLCRNTCDAKDGGRGNGNDSSI